MMKRIGIIGGLGPEATVDYYKGIIEAFKTGEGDLNYPEIIVYSVNMSVFIGLMRKKKFEEATAYLAEKIDKLAEAGADFAALSANTPHQLFEELRDRSRIPLLSIVEATRDKAERKGLSRPGLFGTGLTMKATFYQDVFRKKNLEVILPNANDRDLIDNKLFSEIELGVFKDETKRALVGIIEKMVYENSIDSIILGCTELPLILENDIYAGIPVLNTTKIHVEAIAKLCYQNVTYDYNSQSV